DAEAKVYVPLGSLLLRYETELFVMGMPESGMFVFVEPLALVMGEGSAVRQRLSLDFPLPRAPSLTIGPAVEPVWVASRPESPWVIRAGLSARFYLFDDVELRSDLLPVIVSPDTLGRVGSHFF